MNHTILTAVFFLSSLGAFAHSIDSLVYDSEKITIIKNIAHNTYKIIHKEDKAQFDNLKFIERIAYYYQIIDSEGNIFYLNEDFDKRDEVVDYFGVCGTVPNYKLSVVEKGKFFVVMENSGYHDISNDPGAKEIMRIPKTDCDSVLFINGESEFHFDANYGVGINAIDVRTVFIKKDGKYSAVNRGFFDESADTLTYDSIDFSSSYPTLKTERNGLYGMLNVVEPKYTEISGYTYYLASAVLPSGKKVYIDLAGNEY